MRTEVAHEVRRGIYIANKAKAHCHKPYGVYSSLRCYNNTVVNLEHTQDTKTNTRLTKLALRYVPSGKKPSVGLETKLVTRPLKPSTYPVKQNRRKRTNKILQVIIKSEWLKHKTKKNTHIYAKDERLIEVKSEICLKQ